MTSRVPLSQSESGSIGENSTQDGVELQPVMVSDGVFRWLAILFAIAICVALMFFLPHPYPAILLLVVAAGALVVGAYDAGISSGDIAGMITRARRLASALDDHAPTGVFNIPRSQLARGFAITACCFMAFSAIAFSPNPAHELYPPPTASIFLILGGLALGAAVKMSPKEEMLSAPLQVELGLAHAQWGLTVLGVLLLMVCAEINAKVLNISLLAQVPYRVQFLLLVLGIVLVGMGLGGLTLSAPRRWLQSSVWQERFRRIDWGTGVPLILILAIALGVRLWQLDTSVRKTVDEVPIIEYVVFLWWNPNQTILTPLNVQTPYPWVLPVIQAESVGLFGRTLTAVRLPNVISGTLTVFALYLFAEALFDRKTALLAAFFLAVFPPHIHFSRLSLMNGADPLWGTLALAGVARGIKYNRRADWTLGGIALGLTSYFFEGGRVLFSPLVVIWIIAMIVVLRGHLRAQWRGLLITLIAAFFVAAPVYYTLRGQDNLTATRFSESMLTSEFWSTLWSGGVLDGVGKLAERIIVPALVFVRAQEFEYFYYGGEGGLILVYAAPLFFLGVFYMLWRWRTPALILLLWILATLAGNALLRNNTITARYIVAFPAIALLMAVGLRYTLPLIAPSLNVLTSNMVIVGLASVLGVAQVSYYFGPHLAMFNRQNINLTPYPDGVDAVLRAAEELPSNVPLILVSDPPHDQGILALLEFFVRNFDQDPNSVPLRTLWPSDVTADFLESLPVNRQYAFFLEKDDRQTLELISTYFHLAPPEDSPYSTVPEKEYRLYLATGRITP